MASILVAEDDATSARYMALVLEELGHRVRTAPNGLEALLALEAELPDLVISDLQMPEMDGQELLRRIRACWSELPAIVISIQEDVEIVVSAVRHGAVNYLLKPCSPERIRDAVERALRERPPPGAADGQALSRIVGRSRAIVEVRQAILLAAKSDVPVLLTGRTGTGKEIAARTIHELSNRSNAAFVAHNCALIPRELFESTLFGHHRGAFTGADRDHDGLLQKADGGILFLDEVEAMHLDFQAKLLRVLDDGEVLPVGATSPRFVSVRFVAATNRDPAQMIQEGELREDFYYRLRGIEILLPPLRERMEDVPLLAEHFLGPGHPGFSPAALALLAAHDWPGNVRELRSAVQSARARSGGARIEPEHLGFERREGAAAGTQPAAAAGTKTLKEAEYELIRNTLNACRGNQSQAARALGIDRTTLRRKIGEHSRSEDRTQSESRE